MKNIRKQTYTLEQYLKDMKAEKIRTDQECQRLSGQWNPNMVNELIASVLTDDYIPPIILGEETTSDRKSTRLNSSHSSQSRMPSSA